MFYKSSFTNSGFTIVEFLVAVGVFLILTGLMAVNFIRPQTKANVDSIAQALFSDIKNQQTKAMVGDATGQSTSQAYGVYFNNNQYTLFQGSSYVSNNQSNFTVNLSNVTVTSTFPSNQLVFSRVSGEVSNFTAGSNTITVSSGSNQKVLTVNQYGAVSIQ